MVDLLFRHPEAPGRKRHNGPQVIPESTSSSHLLTALTDICLPWSVVLA